MIILKVLGFIVVGFGIVILLIDTFKKLRMDPKIKEIKGSIQNGSYDWDKAIEDSANKILDNPESLLWQ